MCVRGDLDVERVSVALPFGVSVSDEELVCDYVLQVSV